MEIKVTADDPKSWTDLGMNWNNPDPRQAKYIRALALAVCERVGAATQNGYNFPLFSHRYLSNRYWTYPRADDLGNPGDFKVVNTIFADWCVSSLSKVVESYYRKGYNYADDWSDFPMSWNWGDIVDKSTRPAFKFPIPGHTLKGDSEWLKAMYRIVNTLRYPYATSINATVFSRTESAHDPKTIEESLSQVVERFNENYQEHPTWYKGTQYHREMVFSTRQYVGDKRGPNREYRTFRPSDPKVKLFGGGLDITAWSGNTDYKYVWDYDDDKFVHGYCGYIEAKGITVTEVTNPLAGRKCRLIPIVVSVKKEDKVSFSTELSSSKFVAFKNLKEGLVELDSVQVPLSSPVQIGPSVKDFASIAKNNVAPESEYEYTPYSGRRENPPYGYYTAKKRKSALVGFKGRVIFVLDFGVDGGFRFFAG